MSTWAEQVDPTSGLTYYWNLVTGESSWTNPNGKRDGDFQDGPQAKRMNVGGFAPTPVLSGGGGGHMKEILHISTNNRGAIIGKGGTRINEIRNTSGANVKLEQEAVNGKCECTISGSASAVMKAKQMIQEITGDYSGGTTEDSYAFDTTGRPLYDGGVAAENDIYAGAGPDPAMPPTSTDTAAYPPPQSLPIPGMLPGMMPGMMPMYYDPSAVAGLYGDPYAAFAQPAAAAAPSALKGGADSFDMAQGDVGRMIGKGGQTIKGIRETSRCIVKVENDEGQGTRKVTLTGDANAIALARQMIEEATGASLPPQGGAPAY